MAVAVIVLKDVTIEGQVKGKYTVDATPGATYIPIGFTPSVVMVWNVTTADAWFIWSEGMADGTAIKMNTIAAAISSGGITPVHAHTGEISSSDNTNVRPTQGFLIGTDTVLQVADAVYEFVAFR
jgi:hypothetical protein